MCSDVQRYCAGQYWERYVTTLAKGFWAQVGHRCQPPPRDSALIPEQMRGTGHRYGPVSVVTYAYVSYAFRHVAHAGTKMCMACLLCKASLKP